MNETAEAENSGNLGRHAAPEDELEQIDGYDNSIQNNLAVKRRQIQQLREQYNQLKTENQQLQQKGGHSGYGPDNQQEDF